MPHTPSSLSRPLLMPTLPHTPAQPRLAPPEDLVEEYVGGGGRFLLHFQLPPPPPHPPVQSEGVPPPPPRVVRPGHSEKYCRNFRHRCLQVCSPVLGVSSGSIFQLKWIHLRFVFGFSTDAGVPAI